MSKFTPQEIEKIIQSMDQPPPKEKGGKIPLRAPGSYGAVSKVAFAPLEGEKLRPLDTLTEKEFHNFSTLKAHVEVIFGKTKLTLKELAALQPGSLLPLEELCDDLVDIYVNGTKVGRGEIVAVEGSFGVKIVSFTQADK